MTKFWVPKHSKPAKPIALDPDMVDMLLTPVINLSQVSLTPDINGTKVFPFVVDTGNKFITIVAGVNNTGGKFIASVNDTSNKKVKLNSVSLSLERHDGSKTKLYVCIPSP